MLNVSAKWQRAVMLDNDINVNCFADIVTASGEKIPISDSELWANGFEINDSTSSNGTFTIGALIAGKLKIKLNNIYEDYSKYDFDKASVTAYVSKSFSDGTTEKLKIGEYRVSETSYDGSLITLTCLDNINNFNREYDSNLSYPTTAYEVVRDACIKCDVPFTMARFDNSDYVINEIPSDNQKLTYGQVIAYILQLSGLWGKCGHDGELLIGWYDMSQFGSQDYNGGTFSTKTTPYSDGDTLNGGNFTDYSSGDSVDGGTFTESRNYHNVYTQKDLNVATDDVVITGVKVTVTSKEDKTKDVNALAGKEGYVVSISDNPFISADKAQTIANYIFKKIGGMRFRPLDATLLSNPLIESGDVALVTDRKQNTYSCFISNRTFTVGSGTKISCDAENALRNSADKFSNETKAIVQARKVAQAQLSAYDKQMQLLTQLMSQSLGLFKTEQVQEDGSIIYIMHNKADLNSSNIQWKMTANGMAVSSDYGKTWKAGIDKDGNAVFNIMSAIGINFDWAHGGTLTLGGENNVNGKQYVKDANGKILITLDNKGITLADGVNISWNNISNQPSIPSKTSDLTNDSNYATTAQIPTKNSQLENDSDYTTMSAVEKKNYTTMAAVLEKKYQNSDQVVTITKNTVTAAFIKTLGLLVGDQIQMGPNAKITWANVTNQPTIPTDTNDLTNGAGYTTMSAVEDKGYVVPEQIADFITNDDLAEYARLNFYKDLNELKNNIGYTEINNQYVISPHIYAGTVTASNFVGCKYDAQGTKKYLKKNYTSNDTDKIEQIVSGGYAPNIDDFFKLDVDGNGKIDVLDAVIIRNKIINGNDLEYTRRVVIDPSESGTIVFYQNGEVTGYMAPKGINVGSVYTGYLETHDSVQMYPYGQYTNPVLSIGQSNDIFINNMTATNSTVTSDARLKKNVKKIPQECIDGAMKVDLVQYQYISKIDKEERKNFGIIAQDVAEKMGLQNDENFGILSKSKEFPNVGECYSVSYEQFLILRLAGDEQKIDKMQKHIDELEDKFSRLCQKLGIDESEV